MSFADWMKTDSEGVREYAQNKEEYAGLEISLDEWLDSDEAERRKHKKMIERKARIEERLKNKAS